MCELRVGLEFEIELANLIERYYRVSFSPRMKTSEAVSFLGWAEPKGLTVGLR